MTPEEETDRQAAAETVTIPPSATRGRPEAAFVRGPTRASVMMVPDADQVKTSICPGVSISTYLRVQTGHHDVDVQQEGANPPHTQLKTQMMGYWS